MFGILNGPNETLVSNSCLFLPKNPNYAIIFGSHQKYFYKFEKKKNKQIVSTNSFYILKITIYLKEILHENPQNTNP